MGLYVDSSKSENELKRSYLNENVITEMLVDKMCNGIKQELQNCNQVVKKDTENEETEQTIIPLTIPIINI